MPPITMANPGDTKVSEQEPIMTPPASEALSMISISSLPKIILATPAAVMTLALIESAVFTTTLYWEMAGAKAPLKLGQKQNRKMVPIIAMYWLV